MSKTIVVGMLLGLLGGLLIGSVGAQEHRHPKQDADIHLKFYRTWNMPDNRTISCCHEEDCAPAETRFENGRWFARKVGDDGDFTLVLPQKIEQDRDSPDGRSHVCGRRYGFNKHEFSLFCFIPGISG